MITKPRRTTLEKCSGSGQTKTDGLTCCSRYYLANQLPSQETTAPYLTFEHIQSQVVAAKTISVHQRAQIGQRSITLVAVDILLSRVIDRVPEARLSSSGKSFLESTQFGSCGILPKKRPILQLPKSGCVLTSTVEVKLGCAGTPQWISSSELRVSRQLVFLTWLWPWTSLRIRLIGGMKQTSPWIKLLKVYYMGKRGGQQEGVHLLLVRGRQTSWDRWNLDTPSRTSNQRQLMGMSGSILTGPSSESTIQPIESFLGLEGL